MQKKTKRASPALMKRAKARATTRRAQPAAATTPALRGKSPAADAVDTVLQLKTAASAMRDQVAVGVLAKAADAISGDRAATHGDFVATHELTAQLWSASLGFSVQRWQVPLMLAQAKQARALRGDPGHLDHHVDQAGYAAQAYVLAPSKA